MSLPPAARTVRLDSEARSRDAPPLRPVDAATLIVLDESGSHPRVLMGRRSERLRFMPGKFVFPGGRVDPGDARMPAATPLPPLLEQRLMSSAPRLTTVRCRAIAMAAIRETFEETGLMIGAPGAPGPARVPGGVWREFADEGLLPRIDALTFVARAITPPRRPRRFDTRFFVARTDSVGRAVERQIGPEAELTELVWVALEQATQLDLPTITQIILIELAERLRVGLEADRPVPFYYERNRRFLRAEV